MGENPDSDTVGSNWRREPKYHYYEISYLLNHDVSALTDAQKKIFRGGVQKNITSIKQKI